MPSFVAAKMEKEEAREWSEAQSVRFSVDLVEAAKKHMKFLTAVDRNRHLYEDHALKRAIYRYNAFWLPLLAKHLDKPVVDEEPLVVPLDCEWIWHCHRLNPLRYKFDCEKLFGRILGNHNVISSVEATSKSKTEEIWNKMYPGESYELDLSKPFSEDDLRKGSENAKFTSYDLVAAVKRQKNFAYQVSKPYAIDDLYLKEAERRYKGFLHMIKTNDKMNRKCSCVPTFDIDLMWHTHQLYPDSYCKDLSEIIGRVVNHNDNVPDRSPENTLQSGFLDMTRLWEEDYGKNYWSAGTLRKGDPPTPVTQFPVNFVHNTEDKKLSHLYNCCNPIQFPSMKAIEVHLEFVKIKNLPEGHKGNPVVYFSKQQADKFLNAKRSLSISSEFGEKRVAYFKCEPTGDFLFELMSKSSTGSNELELLGSCSLSLQELVASRSKLSADLWLPMEPVSGNTTSSEPILVHTSISFTPPVLSPQVLQFARSQSSSKGLTQVLDQDRKQVLTLDMRAINEDNTKYPIKEVYCISGSGENHKLAELVGNHWSIKGSDGSSLKLQSSSKNDESLIELVGYNKMVKLFPGRRLGFEIKSMEKQTLEQGFLTAIEFSIENPYGKAVALIDFKSESIQAVEEWIILPAITLTFLLSKIRNTMQVMSKTGETVDGFTECAECYQGVHVGGKNGDMVKNGVGVDVLTVNYGDKVKESGCVDCAKCNQYEIVSGESYAACIFCSTYCVPQPDEGNTVLSGVDGEIGNIIKHRVIVNYGDKVKESGCADCAKCNQYEIVSGENYAACIFCSTYCVPQPDEGNTVLSGDNFAQCRDECIPDDADAGNKVGDYQGMVKDGAFDNGNTVLSGDNFAQCRDECIPDDADAGNKVGDYQGMVKDGAFDNGNTVLSGDNFAQCRDECIPDDGNKAGDYQGMVKDGLFDNGIAILSGEIFAQCRDECVPDDGNKEAGDYQGMVKDGGFDNSIAAVCF